MKIYSWNVNGLRSIMSKNFLEFIETKKPDVLCLQETRVDDALVEKLNLPFKYKMFSHADKKGYSGTAILSNIEPTNMGEFRMEGHPHEGRITYADFSGFKLVSTYVPNSQDELRRLDYRQKWDADFVAYLKSCGNVVVCGDMNVAHNEIDLARPAANHFSAGFSDEERADFTTLLNDANLIDVWRDSNPETKDVYTWWSYRGGARSRNVGWRIDYFLVSQAIRERVLECGISNDVLGSDHCPVFIDIA